MKEDKKNGIPELNVQLSVQSQLEQEPGSIDHTNGHLTVIKEANHPPLQRPLAQIFHGNTKEDLLSAA